MSIKKIKEFVLSKKKAETTNSSEYNFVSRELDTDIERSMFSDSMFADGQIDGESVLSDGSFPKKNKEKKSRISRAFAKKSRESVSIINSSDAQPKRKRGGIERQKPADSILKTETKAMDRSRRLLEQQGERRFAKVNAREHSLNEQEQPQAGLEGELQNNILQHPVLDSQRFDGVDPNLNPEPPLNTAARTEYDNQKREQEMEKQLRLGNMPKFNSTPRPNGP